jgi:adenylate cyclase
LVVFLMLGSFAFILIGEVRYQQDRQRRETIEMLRKQASQKLENIKRSISPRLQLQNILLDFQRRITEIIHKEKAHQVSKSILQAHQEIFKKPFPNHDWFLTDTSLLRPEVIGQLGKCGIDEALAQALNRFQYDPLAATKEQAAIESKLAHALKFPLKLRNIFEPSLNQNLQTTVRAGGAFGTYYGQLEVGSRKYLLFFLLDLRNLSPGVGVRLIADSWREPFSGVAFHRPESGDLILSNLFRENPRLRQILRSRARGDQRVHDGEEIDQVVFFSETVPSPSAFQPLVAYDLRGFPQGRLFSAQLVVGSILMCFLATMFAVVEKLVFQRGIKLNLRQALLLTFLLVAIIPGAGVLVFSLRTQEEYSRKSLQEVARQLHLDLLCLDEGLQIFHGNFIRKIIRIGTAEETVKNIAADEVASAKSASNESSGATMEKVAQQIGLGTRSSKSDLLNNLVSVVGPGNFTQSWTTAGPDATREEQDNMMMLMGPLGRINLREFGAGSEDSGEQLAANESQAQMDGLIIESLLDAMKGMTTPELFLRTIYYPDEIQEFRSMTGRGYYLQLPLFLAGIVRYTLFVFWDQSLLDRPYLQKSLIEEASESESYQNLFAASINVRMAPEVIPPDVSSFPRLIDLMDRSRVAKNTARLILPQEQLVLEAMPGFYANQFMLAGQRDASRLFREGNLRLLLLQFGVLLEIILSLLAAFMGARFFLEPLSRLVGGLGEIDRGNFAVRLDASRPDEFGSLAQAFNRMSETLQEGQLLGKYVPSSVLRALTDEDFKARALEGESIQVTVLFSGFAEMEQFQRISDPTSVLLILNQHFGAAQTAVEKFGGEIDKVMGDKILMTFEHRRLGGNKQAAELALRVIEFMKELLESEGCPLEVAAGINTGQVIAGFFGAANLRQDYTIIGDTVNVAARLLGVAPSIGGSRIVVSGNTRKELADTSRLRKLPLVQVKGKTQKVDAYLLE